VRLPLGPRNDKRGVRRAGGSGFVVRGSDVLSYPDISCHMNRIANLILGE